MMVTKGATEADAIALSLQFVFLSVMDLSDDIDEGVIKCGKKVDGLLEQTICKVSVIVAKIVDVDYEACLISAEHARDVISVVVDRGIGNEELLEYTGPVTQKIILRNRFVEHGHGE